MSRWDIMGRMVNHVSRFACGRLSYGAVLAFWKTILRSPFGRRWAYARAAKLFRLLDEAHVDYDPLETATRAALLDKLFPWAYCRFVTCPLTELERWVRGIGLEHLTTSLATGRGILLAGDHFGPGHMVEHFLSSQGYRIHVLRGRDKFAPYYGLTQDDARLSNELCLEYDMSIGRLQTTATIRDVLRRGGIVHAALDGKSGKSETVQLPLLGRYRSYFTSLPLVAALSNAVIVPVHATVLADGCIEVRFEKPIPDRSPDQDPKAYAKEVVTAYVARLQAFCEAEPGSVKDRRFRWLPKAPRGAAVCRTTDQREPQAAPD